MIVNKKLKFAGIGLAIVVKVSYMLLFAYWNQPELFIENIQWYAFGGDARDYVEPTEKLLSEGKYYFAENIYAGRMPGFTFLYLPLRFLFSQHWALNFTLLFQAIFSGISVYYLAQIYYLWTQHKAGTFLVFMIYLLSSYVSNYDGYLLTESLACSSLIFSLYLLLKFQSLSSRIILLGAGIFGMWAVFCRPFLLPVLCAGALFLSYPFFKQIQKKISWALLFLAPFIIADSLWIIRNYNIEGKFIPLQSNVYKGAVPRLHQTGLYTFIKSFGGEVTWWHPDSEGMWFRTDAYLEQYHFHRPSDAIFPQQIFTPPYTIDSLKYARLCAQLAEDSTLSIEKRTFYENEAARVLKIFETNFVANYPLFHYAKAPFLVLKKFIFQAYTFYFPYSFNNATFFQKTIKIFHLALNVFMIPIGFLSLLGILLYKRKRLTPADLLLAFTPLFIIILFSFYFRTSQYRYLTVAVPFLLLFSVYFFDTAKMFFKNKN